MLSAMRPATFLALLAALACHPAQRAEQALSPVSAPDAMVACVHSALEGSPNVAEVQFAKDRPRTQYVRFLNPPGQGVGGMALVVAPSRGSPRQLVAEYTLWIGDPNMPGTSDQSGAAVAEAGTRLLLQARDQCAPAAPGMPSCSLMPAFGQDGQKTRTGRCSIGV